ncbi:hypothetical protein [Paracoccus alkanivorans]|uniref:SGNH/GDSL hydrolase family protein n=1 Tax=Paracoccus alkanivorans TaxID=2116655 RepID=A0A3M0MIA7_9RHOB|nr:hypothetical protein [Paracoccus alkanivorans]RMC37476.1 hypothetical protein C9E81_01620 [Paracoccus alkanivorans]
MKGTNMKLCIVGNSHIACLRSAMNGNDSFFKNNDVTFFGAPRRMLTKLATDQSGRKLIAPPRVERYLQKTSGGLINIELDKYDAFLVGGLSYAVQSLVPTFASDQYSSEVRRATVRDYWTSQTINQVIGVLRSVCAAPIFVMHAPLAAVLDPVQVPESVYASMIETSQDAYFDDFSARLLRQPDSTLNGGMATRREYSVGSVRLEGVGSDDLKEHHEDETEHMNAAFGGIMLNVLAEELSRVSVRKRASA